MDSLGNIKYGNGNKETVITILERKSVSKSGQESANEDRIICTDHFVAVVDGMTPKNNELYIRNSSAIIAVDLIENTMQKLSRESTFQDVAEHLTCAIKNFYEHNQLLPIVSEEPSKRIAASIIIFSTYREEVWFIGDCQCMVDGIIHKNEKIIDYYMADLRVKLFKEYLKEFTEEELLNEDLSRKDLLPFFTQQHKYQNANFSSPLSYAVIDGFAVNPKQIKVINVSGAREIILASDGYPVLKPTLADSEHLLSTILNKDPFCIDIYKSTKGKQRNNLSFDDRSYIRMQIEYKESLT